MCWWLEVWEAAQNPLAELDAKLQPGTQAEDDLIPSALGPSFWDKLRSQEVLLTELANIDPHFGVLSGTCAPRRGKLLSYFSLGHVLDVLVGLSLRVDHQGPAPAILRTVAMGRRF